MQTAILLQRRNLIRFMLLWAAILLVGFLFFIFLHEVGHGLGARIDGIHVSTGFNKVGGYGKFPQDPDFRADMPGGFWSGLLGPMTSWALAIVSTIWLFRFKSLSNGALMVSGMALVNGLVRAIPMAIFLTGGITGSFHMEDEVGWGLWLISKICIPGLAALDSATLLSTQVSVLVAEPMFWIPPLLSLGISLACLIPAYRRLSRLLDNKAHPVPSWMIGLVPFVMYFVATPILNSLDRLIRINW